MFLVQTSSSTEKMISYCDSYNVATISLISQSDTGIIKHEQWMPGFGSSHLKSKRTGLFLLSAASHWQTMTVGGIYYGRGCQVFQWQWPPWTRIQHSEKTGCVSSESVFIMEEEKHSTLPLIFEIRHLNEVTPVRIARSSGSLEKHSRKCSKNRQNQWRQRRKQSRHRFSSDPFQVTSLPWHYNLEATARPIKPNRRRAPWENRPTRAAALGHLTRLGSNACLLLQDTRDLWGWCVCLCVLENTEDTHTHTHTHTHTRWRKNRSKN